VPVAVAEAVAGAAPASEPVVAVELPAASPDAGRMAEVEPKGPVAARRGRVQFLVKPWAEIFLNGRSLGLTPLPPLSLPAGRTTFVLRNEKLKVERKVSVVVRGGGTVTVKEDLLE
jgi:serine/threonine-protein kinase